MKFLAFSQTKLGSSLSLPAHGRVGARATLLFLATHFAKKNTNSVGAKSEGEAEGRCGGNSASPEPKRSPAVLLAKSRTQQKGFAIVPIIIIIAVLLIGGAYIALNNQEPTQKTKNIMQNNFNSSNSEQNKNWSTHINQEAGFAVSYPATYHVYGNNLVNYDENKFERSNSSGIKIQVQRHSKENYGYDLSTNGGIKKFIDKLNETIAKNDALENSNSTLAVPFLLGVLKFKNEVLSGPGGAFNIYYAFANNDTYYTILVWGEKNDQETVNKILSTFKIIADSANQTNTQSHVQKSR